MRNDWDSFWHEMAELWSRRSTCPRAQVGAVIVDRVTHELVGAGFNGAARGWSHCDEAGCTMQENHCVRAIHAEVNAIFHALRNRNDLSGLAIYCTHQPCTRCEVMLAHHGIFPMYWKVDYPNGRK